MTIRRRGHAAGLAVLLGLALTGCGGTTGPASSAGSSAPPPAVGSTGPATETITLDITISGGRVTPNGQKIDARVGQRVVEHVTSDVDDEVHAHTGGDGYELEVKAGTPATGGFTLTTPGSFEVESHGTGKIIAILNVR
jgi:hypothetical protein